MKMTLAEAAKMLRKLNEERDTLLAMESKSATFTAVLGEDPETERPKYDYDQTQKNIEQLNRKIITLKHALNRLNTTTEVPGFHMTIDELLVCLPQLTQQRQKLKEMCARLPKERVQNRYGSSNVVDFQFVNYNIEQARKDYDRVSEELALAQVALDQINASCSIELDI